MSEVKFWVLLYEDAANPHGIPATRPAEISRTPQRSPWLEMTLGEYEDLLASTQAVYDAWRSARPIPPSAVAGPLVSSPDGQRWEITITNSGTIGKRKV